MRILFLSLLLLPLISSSQTIVDRLGNIVSTIDPPPNDSTGKAVTTAWAQRNITAGTKNITINNTIVDTTGYTTVKINYYSADKIVLISNSYGAGYYGLPNKMYFGRLSALSDYNFENYSASGYNVNQLSAAIAANTKLFNNSYGIQDYNGSRALICEFTNSLSAIINADHNLDNYIAGFKKLIRQSRALGMTPIIATQWRMNYDSAGNPYSRLALSALRNLATQEKCLFIDATPTGEVFDNNQTNRRWVSGHPGTMTEAVFSNELAKALNENLPRPVQTLKIFTKRDAQSINKDSLFYSNIEERDRRFFEIKLSQVAFQSVDAPYYDDLISYVGAGKSTVTYGDYLKLLSTSQNLIIPNDYSIIESVLPGNSYNTASVNISLPLSSGTVQIWVKNNLTGTYDSLTTGITATITAKKYIDVDKITFLIYNAGGYTLTTSPLITWIGYPVKDSKNYSEKIIPATGTQILTKTSFENADISDWGITNRVPIDGQNPKNITRVGFVSGATTASQDFTLTNTANGRDIQVEVWCRRYVPLFPFNGSNPPVTSDSYDYGTLEININDKAQSNISIKRQVAMHWVRLLVNTHISAGQTSLNLKLKSADSSEIELAYASVKYL